MMLLPQNTVAMDNRGRPWPTETSKKNNTSKYLLRGHKPSNAGHQKHDGNGTLSHADAEKPCSSLRWDSQDFENLEHALSGTPGEVDW